MIEHIATPYALILEQQRLSSIDTSSLTDEQQAGHVAAVIANSMEMAKYGDQEMSPESEAAHLADQETIAAEAAIINKKKEALDALEVGDDVARRCFKEGIPYPDAWRSRDVTLRRIVNGEDLDIPAQPEYP